MPSAREWLELARLLIRNLQVGAQFMDLVEPFPIAEKACFFPLSGFLAVPAGSFVAVDFDPSQLEARCNALGKLVDALLFPVFGWRLIGRLGRLRSCFGPRRRRIRLGSRELGKKLGCLLCAYARFFRLGRSLLTLVDPVCLRHLLLLSGIAHC